MPIHRPWKHDVPSDEKSERIDALLESMSLSNVAKIESDYRVSVYTSVNIDFTHLVDRKLPFAWSKVAGSFYAKDIPLVSLEGFPHEVSGGVDISGTQISSIKGLPSKIGDYLEMTDTKITSLVGIADAIEAIHGSIYFDDEKLREGGLGLLLVKGLLGFSHSRPGPLDIINEYFMLDNREDGIFDCQEELLRYGFEKYAQL